MQDDPICSSAGCTEYKFEHKKPPYPVDYFVPNFGQDHDISNSIHAEKITAERLGHNWTWEKKEAVKTPDYKTGVPLDESIQASLKNLNQMEKKYGNWVYDDQVDYDAVQTGDQLN